MTFQRVYISIKAPKIHTSTSELKQRPSLHYYEHKSYFIWNRSCKMTVSKAVWSLVQRNIWYSKVSCTCRAFSNWIKTRFKRLKASMWEHSSHFFLSKRKVVHHYLFCLLRVWVIHSYIQIILQVLQCTKRVSLSFFFKPAKRQKT